MSTTQDPCLSAPEILAYLGGELTQDRKAQIARHLDECRLCGDAVEGAAGLEWREGFLRSTDSLRARVRTRTAKAVAAAAVKRSPVRRLPFARPAQLYLTVAATLVVGVGAAVILSRPGPAEALFRRHFEPYPSTQPTVRGAVRENGSEAMALYEEGDYRRALAALEDRLARQPDDAVSRFYAGVCRLSLGQSREATLDLEQVLQMDEKELHAPAEWYLALAHIKSGDLVGARTHLQRIAGAGGFYQDKARALLAELEAAGNRR
jgi:tetratricopeptide (TPR) repeat protein